MIMGFPHRFRYWSVLQVVAIVVCYRGKVSSDDRMNLTGVVSTEDDHNSDPDNSDEEPTKELHNSGYLTSTDGTLTSLSYNTEAGNQSNVGPATPAFNSHNLTITDGTLTSLSYYTETDDQSDPGPTTPASNSRYLTSTDGTFTSLSYNTGARDQSDTGPATPASNSHNLTSTDVTLTNLSYNTESGDQSDAGPTTTAFNSHYFTSTDGTLTSLSYNTEAGNQKRAQDCVGSQLSLRCPEMKIIQITAVGLGDSYCIGASCCIRDNDCTHNATANHTMDVHRRCCGQSNCTVDVIKENIPCGYWGFWKSNYFERITYNCTDDPRNEESTEDVHNPETDNGGEDQTKKTDNSDDLTSAGGTLTSLSYNTEADDQSDTGPATTAIILHDGMSSTADEESTEDDHNSDPDNNNEEPTTEQDNSGYLTSADGTLTSLNNNQEAHDTSDPGSTTDETNSDNLASTDGTLTSLSYNTEAGDQSHPGPTTTAPNSQALTVVTVIICPIILLAIVFLVIVMYQRKKRTQMKLFDPVAMTEVDNRQNESDINATETQRTSLHKNNVPLSLFPTDEAEFLKTDEDPAVCSEVVQRKTTCKEGQNDRLSADKTNAAIETHTAGPDVYAVVNNPATSSAIKTDQVGVKDIVNQGDCFPDKIYSLASNGMEDIYTNETAVDSSTQLVAEAVSKTPSPQDDEDQTVIENDLNCH